MKRSKRRPIVKFLLLLIAGAMLNVAVAWGFALWEPLPTRNPADVSKDAPRLLGPLWPAPPATDAQVLQASAQGLTTTTAVFEDEPTRIVIVTQAGWPLRSLDGAFDGAFSYQRPTVYTLHHAIEISPSIRPRNAMMPDLAFVLPLRPLWPGFAINTMFYAGVLWMLFCGPFALRRMIRRRRGRCPVCAYPIGQSPVCTECGAAVGVPR